MDLTQFIDRLRIIPSYFNLNIVNIPSGKLRTVLEKMDFDETNESFSMMHRNLASFISFIFKDLSGCKERNNWVLERYPRNINANTIKSVLSFQDGSLTEANKGVEYLEKLSTDEFLMAEAKAEIANAYSRMGARYYSSAITTFEDAIQNFPHVYEWKYRLALTIRRCQNKNIKPLLPQALSNTTENFIRCKKIFDDVLANTDNVELKALATVEIATLYISQNTSGLNFEKLGINVEDRESIIIRYLDKAVELSDANEKVLSETGRILRTLKKFAAARDILETAVNIYPTTTNCHHLALVLKKLDGTAPEALAYFEQSVDLSQGLNYPAVVDLGKSYLESSPPDYSKALKCFTKLMQTKDFKWITQGCVNASICYKTNLVYLKQKRPGYIEKLIMCIDKMLCFVHWIS